MKILFAGGGTAGHITPAIAIAEELLKTDGNSVAFVLRKDGAENRLVKNKGYEFFGINAKGMERRITITNILNIFKNLLSVMTSLKIINSYKPDAVVGTGGYVCWPVLKAARLSGVPTFIHESNLYPGMSTRNLAPSCKKVLLNYEGTKEHLKKTSNTVVVGNPIREEFEKTTRSVARRRLRIGENTILTVSFGGSGGAQRINDAIIGLMKKEKEAGEFLHVHASGEKYYQNIKEELPELCRGGERCRIVPYLDDVPLLLSAADIIISRCGAMTLSEISAVGIPSILIPSPNVTDDHQKKNADYLVKRGAAIMIEEKDLDTEALCSAWSSLSKSKRKRQAMGRCAKELFTTEAAKKIVEEIYKVL